MFLNTKITYYSVTRNELLHLTMRIELLTRLSNEELISVIIPSTLNQVIIEFLIGLLNNNIKNVVFFKQLLKAKK